MPLTMPCISLHQPWASLIGNGKLFETRSWPTNHRGLLAIHAAKRFTPEARALLETEPFRTSLLPMVQDTLIRPELFAWALERALPFGKIVAVCRLVDCQEIRPNYGPADGKPFRDKKRQPQIIYKPFSYDGGQPVIAWEEWYRLPPPEPERAFGDYADHRFAWKLEDIRVLKTPLPCKGRQRFWNVTLPDLPELDGLKGERNVGTTLGG